MFFPAFDKGVTSPLSSETTFTVEYLISQILVNADRKFLEECLEKGRLIDALLRELEFFGHVRKNDLPSVQEYVSKQKISIQDAAKHLMEEFENQLLRRDYLSHQTFQAT